jgi:hypothetical protein
MMLVAYPLFFVSVQSGQVGRNYKVLMTCGGMQISQRKLSQLHYSWPAKVMVPALLLVDNQIFATWWHYPCSLPLKTDSLLPILFPSASTLAGTLPFQAGHWIGCSELNDMTGKCPWEKNMCKTFECIGLYENSELSLKLLIFQLCITLV